MPNNYYVSHAEEYAKTHSTPASDFYLDQVNYLGKILPKGAKTILEIGVGHGRDMDLLLPLGLTYYGIDNSDSMIKLAKQRHLANRDQIHLSVQDLNNLSFPDHFFDVIWAAAVYHHVDPKNIINALKEMNLVSKQNAIGFLSVRSGGADYTEEDLERGLTYYHYTKASMQAYLLEAGLTVIETSSRTVYDKDATKEYLQVFFKKTSKTPDTEKSYKT